MSEAVGYPRRVSSDATSNAANAGLGQGTLLVLFAATCWGTWSLLFRPTGLSGSVTAPIVFILIALGSAIPMWREHKRLAPKWKRPLVVMLLAYAFFDALNAATFFSAMNVTTVAVAVLTHDLAPVLVALVSPRIDGVKVKHAYPAALIALFGVVLLLEPWREGALGGNVLLGAMLGGTSALAYACNVFLGRRLSIAVGPFTALGAHSALAALILLPLAGQELFTIEARDVPYLLVAGLVPGLLAGAAFLRGVALVGSARAAILAFLEPLVACIVGYLYFDERLGFAGVIGALLILVAGVLVTRSQTASLGPRTLEA